MVTVPRQDSLFSLSQEQGLRPPAYLLVRAYQHYLARLKSRGLRYFACAHHTLQPSPLPRYARSYVIPSRFRLVPLREYRVHYPAA